MILFSPWAASATQVLLQQAPEQGLQPRSVVDDQGVLHLIYFKGDPKAGDIFYVRRMPGAADFSTPLQVNSRPHDAMAAGSIRGGQMAVDAKGRVHVAWNGSTPSTKVKEGMDMSYARLEPGAKAFEKQLSLLHGSEGLDGGAAVAADAYNHVRVSFSISPPGNHKGEAGRAVFVARSNAGGKTFEKERQATQDPSGACGCCGMGSTFDKAGYLYIWYRAATGNTQRDSTLLVSRDLGQNFQRLPLQAWNLNSCPMSSVSLLPNADGIRAAWETEGQIYFSQVTHTLLSPSASKPQAAPGSGNGRKHPAQAINAKGETLLVWTEGTGWNRGGKLVWQLYGKDGKARGGLGSGAAFPAFDLPSVYAQANGDFSVLY